MPDPTVPERTCHGCRTAYPETTEHFYKDRKGRSGLSSQCRECMKRHGKRLRLRRHNATEDMQVMDVTGMLKGLRRACAKLTCEPPRMRFSGMS